MTAEKILNRVKEIISETIAIPIEKVDKSLSVGDIPQWNSMANMAIVTAIEDAFDIEIPSEDLFELTSVESIFAEVAKIKGL